MTSPMSAAQIAATAPGTWGVWDDHRKDWAVPPTLDTERQAWAALLDTRSLWPRLLDVREEKHLAAVEVKAACPECMGSGVCDSCHRDCTRCDGATEILADELSDYERRLLVRLGYLDKAEGKVGSGAP